MTTHIAAFDCQVLKRDKLHVEGILKYSIRILLRKNNQMASNVPKKKNLECQSTHLVLFRQNSEKRWVFFLIVYSRFAESQYR